MHKEVAEGFPRIDQMYACFWYTKHTTYERPRVFKAF